MNDDLVWLCTSKHDKNQPNKRKVIDYCTLKQCNKLHLVTKEHLKNVLIQKKALRVKYKKKKAERKKRKRLKKEKDNG